jgi:hypothetical protein
MHLIIMISPFFSFRTIVMQSWDLGAIYMCFEESQISSIDDFKGTILPISWRSKHRWLPSAWTSPQVIL